MVAKRTLAELFASGKRMSGRELMLALRSSGLDVVRTSKSTHYMVHVGDSARVLVAIGHDGMVSLTYISRLRHALRQEGGIDV
ncbi:hypothetical protein EG835_07825 [bacterium]|nr:hypothetical protein [bacterium]